MDSGQDHCRIIIHHHGIQDVSRNLSFPQLMDDPINFREWLWSIFCNIRIIYGLNMVHWPTHWPTWRMHGSEATIIWKGRIALRITSCNFVELHSLFISSHLVALCSILLCVFFHDSFLWISISIFNIFYLYIHLSMVYLIRTTSFMLLDTIYNYLLSDFRCCWTSNI